MGGDKSMRFTLQIYQTSHYEENVFWFMEDVYICVDVRFYQTTLVNISVTVWRSDGDGREKRKKQRGR